MGTTDRRRSPAYFFSWQPIREFGEIRRMQGLRFYVPKVVAFLLDSTSQSTAYRTYQLVREPISRTNHSDDSLHQECLRTRLSLALSRLAEPFRFLEC